VKYVNIFFCLLLLSLADVNAQTNQAISGNFSGTSFKQFAETVEAQSDYTFYYKDVWVDSLVVNLRAENESIESILNKVFSNSDLQFAIDSKMRIYVTKNRAIMTDLPVDFFAEESNKPAKKTAFDYSDYEQQERKKKIEETKLYSIGDKNSSPQGNATLAGSIRNGNTGEPLIGATVYIEKSKQGVATDQFGFYSFTIPKGRYEIRIKSIGMKSTLRHVMLYSDGKLDIQLDEDVTPLKEVVVESQHEARLTNVQMGVEKLDIQTMKQIPLALGETDVIKVVMTLPGVQSVGEGTTGINVRGGATNQNLILLNDAVVYNPSHLFGFFSTFNPDLLKNVELYKSGIRADYGGRLSSVLDVHTREGNQKKISGSGGISPITGRLSLEGPIVKDKTSFIIGGRSTYSNWILKQLHDPGLSKSRASFYDVTAGITHKAGDNDNIYISAYVSRDRFNLKNDTAYTYSDKNASVKWKHIFNNKFTGVATAAYSNYSYTMSSDKNPVNAFSMDFNVAQVNAKADFSYFANSRHTIDGGVSTTRYNLSPGGIAPLGAESLVTHDVVQREHGLESALYISDNIEINPRLSFYAGLRYSFFQYLGPKDVFRYGNGTSISPSSITDTVAYASGKSIASYSGAEPRLAVRYTIGQNMSVKASYNKMRQYIQMLSNTTAIQPTDTWKLTDTYVKPQVGDQFSVGFYTNISGKRHTIEASVEGYYKIMSRTIDYKNGATLLLNHHLETDILEARGEAYGAEFLIKKNAGKLNGWVSYTYSRSFLKTQGQYADQTVNKGAWYPSNFDKPHAMNFIGNYKVSRRFNFSLNVVYSTGRPITLPIAKYQLGDNTKIFYSDRNAYRIPDYFRMDVSINFEGNHKVKKLAHSSWTLAVYNLTSRANAYSVFFRSENGQIKGYKLSIFAQAIPTITYNFKF
jgi:hypothetical protein